MLELLHTLEESSIFKSWKQEHPDYYLSSCFATYDNNKKPEWQFHFYNKKKDKIVTFSMGKESTGKEITIEPESKIFKKKSAIVEELEIEKVKIEINQALRKIQHLEQYQHEDFTQKILILQQQQQPIWNISLITSTYQIINIKLSAISGSVLEESKESLLSFKSPAS